MRKGTVAVVGAVAATVGVGLVLELLHEYTTPPISLLMLPILAAAYVGRLPAGFAATITAATFAFLALIDQDASVAWIRPLALIVVGVSMSFAIDALHRARLRADAERRDAIESKHRFSRLFHASPVALCLSRLDNGKVSEVNVAYTNLFCLAASQVLGRTPIEAGLVVDAGSREALFEKMRAQGWIRDEELRVDTRGGPRDLLVSSQVIELEGDKYSLATFIDVTERRRAEGDARESQQRFRELAENVEEVFFVGALDGSHIQYMSPAYERMYGRSLAALERDPLDWLNAIHIDDRARMKSLFDEPIEAHLDARFRVVLGNGSIRNLRTTVFPIRDASGRVVRIAGVSTDVTKWLELEEQVRQSQKLESLGLLAGGVAHDFNNILAVIGSNVGMLGEGVAPADAELVDEVEKAVTRGASLTRQLLAFSRRQVIEPIVLDLNAVVEDTRKMLRRMVGEDVRLSCSLDPDLHRTTMDPGAMVQVLMNLAVNARDAMPTGGALTMVTRNRGADVVLEVADTGCGMSRELVSRIFEPFFTTKGVGKGTGLGLSVVHGIVQQAGGRIEVNSTVGVGTTFSIALPAVDVTAAASAIEPVVECAGSETILLVDDDDFVRVSAARALRSKGYAVLEAEDGSEALAVFAQHEASVALLVTDVVMPGMDGRQLAEAVRARQPALPVLFTSGYTDDAILRHGIKHDEVSFLEKPFRCRQLASRVRRLLDLDAQQARVA